MKKHVLICAALVLLCLVHTIFAQQTAAPTETQTQTQNEEEELSRFEVGGHYTALGAGYDHGVGGRLTYNVNRYVALESEVNYFPRRFGGNAVQGLFGVKAGKRWDKFGIFGKARPGFIHDSRGVVNFVQTSPNVFTAVFNSRTSFTADLGGVVEFYPTKKLITRFDFGETITRYGAQNATFIDANNNPNTVRIPARTVRAAQFSAGIGFRFWFGLEKTSK